MRIVVCIKEVVDALLPVSELVVDRDNKKILGPPDIPHVINGFDEQALEAALRLKDNPQGIADGTCEIVALSAGAHFTLDIVKTAFAVGADDLVLVQDAATDTWDSHFLARVLASAIHHVGGADLVICGRQASDWDNAQAPLILAEMLGWACLTLARKVEVQGRRVRVERVLGDSFQTMESDLPAVVTVTIERGGRVVTSQLITPSGNAALDRIVRRVLDQVTFIRPFPEGAKDSERTFTIGFELRPKRANG
jgi:electron transfer flavoprotein beta subunit